MKYNLDDCSEQEKKFIQLDLHASGIVFRERHSLPMKEYYVNEMHLKSYRDYFKKRLRHYRRLPKNPITAEQ